MDGYLRKCSKAILEVVIIAQNVLLRTSTATWLIYPSFLPLTTDPCTTTCTSPGSNDQLPSTSTPTARSSSLGDDRKLQFIPVSHNHDYYALHVPRYPPPVSCTQSQFQIRESHPVGTQSAEPNALTDLQSHHLRKPTCLVHVLNALLFRPRKFSSLVRTPSGRPARTALSTKHQVRTFPSFFFWFESVTSNSIRADFGLSVGFGRKAPGLLTLPLSVCWLIIPMVQCSHLARMQLYPGRLRTRFVPTCARDQK